MPEPGAGRQSGPGQDLKNILQLDSSLGWGDHYLIPFLYNNRPDYSNEFSEGLGLFWTVRQSVKTLSEKQIVFIVDKQSYLRARAIVSDQNSDSMVMKQPGEIRQGRAAESDWWAWWRKLEIYANYLASFLHICPRVWGSGCDSSQRMKSLLVTSDFSKMLKFFVMNGNAECYVQIYTHTLPSRIELALDILLGFLFFSPVMVGTPKKPYDVSVYSFSRQ